MKYTLFVLSLFIVSISVSAQSFDEDVFDGKVELCKTLLKKQPTSIELNEILPEGYTVDSLEEFKYHIKAPDGSRISAYLHIENLNIVYVEFFEGNDFYNDIHTYFTKNKNYTWVGTEHNCDYLNNKRTGICICPNMQNGQMIHISKYGS